MRRRQRAVPAILAAALALVLMAGPVAACGGLIGPNGAVNLLRTTTFVGYHAGVEHYVTAFAVRRWRRPVRLDHAAARASRRPSSGAATGPSSG